MSRFGLHTLCLLLCGVALSSAQFPWASSNPQTTYGSTQYPASPYGPSQYPASPYGASQYTASPYGASQYTASPYGSSQYPASSYGSMQYPESPYGAVTGMSSYFGYPALTGYGQQTVGYGYPQMGSQYGSSPMTYPQTGSYGATPQSSYGGGMYGGDTRNVGGVTDDYSTRALSPFGFQSFGSNPSLFSQLSQLQDTNKNGIPDHLEMTKSKIDEYLAKMQQLGNRKLSVQVDYLNTPLEYQFLNQYHGIQHPLSGTSLGDYFNVPKPKPAEKPQYQSQSQYQSQPQYQTPQYQTQPPPQYQSQPQYQAPQYQSQPQYQTTQYQTQSPPQYQPPTPQPYGQPAVRGLNSTITP